MSTDFFNLPQTQARPPNRNEYHPTKRVQSRIQLSENALYSSTKTSNIQQGLRSIPKRSLWPPVRRPSNRGLKTPARQPHSFHALLRPNATNLHSPAISINRKYSRQNPLPGTQKPGCNCCSLPDTDSKSGTDYPFSRGFMQNGWASTWAEITMWASPSSTKHRRLEAASGKVNLARVQLLPLASISPTAGTNVPQAACHP